MLYKSFFKNHSVNKEYFNKIWYISVKYGKQGNFTSVLFPHFVSGQWAYLKRGKFFVSSVFEMKRVTFRANFRSG